MNAAPGGILAVDGGGSKTDVVLLDKSGEVLGWERGPGSSPHLEGLQESVAVIDALIMRVLDKRDPRGLEQVSLYLSGLDLAEEITTYRAAIADRSWAQGSLVVQNDLHALLRAGTDSADAIAVICGTGTNAIGIRGDGVQVRFPALGPLSGDWGGGSELGSAVLWHAARAEDRRGPETALRSLLLAEVEAATVAELIEDVHLGRRPDTLITALAPLLFQAAREGDTVARSVVDRQALEVVAYVNACVIRLGLHDRPVPVVFGGGVARAREPLLIDGIRSGLAEAHPLAELMIVDAPPVLGAALLALADAGATAHAQARVRVGLSTHARFRMAA